MKNERMLTDLLQGLLTVVQDKEWGKQVLNMKLYPILPSVVQWCQLKACVGLKHGLGIFQTERIME